MAEALDNKATRRTPRRPATYVFFALWMVVTLVLAAWIVSGGPLGFNTGIGLPALLGGLTLSLALLWWLPGPALAGAASGERAGRGWTLAAGLGAVGALFACLALFGRGVLYGIPILAAVVLLALRARPAQRELVYGLGLAIAAAVAGLGMRHVQNISPAAWATLQLPLVWLSLLAGWALLRQSGLWQAGLGHSLLLDQDARRAMRGAGSGMLLGIPWALTNVAIGGVQQDTRWATSPLSAVTALQPAIAEEAWARMFLVTLLVVVLRRGRQATRPAVLAAVLIAGYWFGYLHTIKDPSLSSRVIGTIILGTLFSLPLSFLWLRRSFEAAMGFHFLIDAVRFGMAYLVSARIL